MAATMTISRPAVSSPLAEGSRTGAKPTTQKRTTPFASSRPLRPFPSISHVVQPTKATVKIIEPPKNYTMTFTLDLTQAEFSRQE